MKQKRKAQNRQAQRAFRIRQQEALDNAHIRMQALETELQSALTEKNHYERLFYDLTDKYEQLAVKYRQPATAGCDGAPDGAGVNKRRRENANAKISNFD
ncbi:hypothetical protein PV10_04013 [Exophiala mesophila]|uniref:BZIP domain-containing protein n=1 Tax=Exophiala mesophila TaxID=212818 RepID=A0A0D1ZDG2_EXOME|nr:uncharacterized protein PV10_04013 [Exophiala mesophila]KIV92742.1 hypothetical protein PV10_04013 [Exophiala mesophila]